MHHYARLTIGIVMDNAFGGGDTKGEISFSSSEIEILPK